MNKPHIPVAKLCSVSRTRLFFVSIVGAMVFLSYLFSVTTILFCKAVLLAKSARCYVVSFNQTRLNLKSALFASLLQPLGLLASMGGCKNKMISIWSKSHG